MAPSDQPQILKLVDHTAPLQDGVHQDSEGAADAGRLAGEVGPQGCLLSPNSCVPPEILKIPLGKQGMAVPGPPLWPEQCPLHFHQGHEASGSHNEAVGDQIDTLPRRHADHGPGQEQIGTAVGNSSGTPDFIGVHHQLQEEYHGADLGNTIPVLLTGFPGNDDCSTSEQTTFADKDCERVERERADDSPRPSLSLGVNGGSSSSDPASPPILPQPGKSLVQSPAKWPDIRLKYCGGLPVEGGLGVVGNPMQSAQWQATTHPSLGFRDGIRCIHMGLGSELRRSDHRGPLDSCGEVPSHQLSGAPGSIASPEIICSQTSCSLQRSQR